MARAYRSSLSRRASSARLRWVMSTLEPAMRTGFPSASRKHCARVWSHRTSPVAGATILNSWSRRGVWPRTWFVRAAFTRSRSSACRGTAAK
ncbi:MAG: hypothetical protein K0R89_3293 [Ramlibacter sp.]|nr:hypothetical protein [Ramlibacter sp.]